MRSFTGTIKQVRRKLAALAAASLLAIGAPVASGASSLQVDATFNPPEFAAHEPALQVLLVPGGKFVLYWNVETLDDVPAAGGITRYLPDGTLDPSFRFPSDVYSRVSAAAPLADGRLIVSAAACTYGCRSTSGNFSGLGVLRLNADGSIDPSFNVTWQGGVGDIRVMAIQPDGKILVGGTFTGFNGTPRQGIVRLN